MSIFRRAHEHDYQPAAVENNGGGLFSGMSTTTIILRRCSCSDVQSVTIAGRWTLAQVRGEQETADVRGSETTLPVTGG